MFFFLSKTLDLAVSPLTWALAVLLSTVLLRRRYPRWPARGTALAIGILCVFSLEPVSNGLMALVEAPAARTAREDVVYDAALLLGGFVDERVTEDHGAPGYDEPVERMLVTFDLLRAGKARYAIVSAGASAGERVIESHVVGDQLTAWGIAGERVIVEDTALNTRDNAVTMARIARERGFSRLLLVTSAAHMPRALGCFRAVGLEVDTLPVDHRSFDPRRHHMSWQPRSRALTQSASALRELLGRAVYRLRGWSR